jgi:hypothetical protein
MGKTRSSLSLALTRPLQSKRWRSKPRRTCREHSHVRSSLGILHMSPESVSVRFRPGQKLLSVQQVVAQGISDEFFLNHPDWVDRYGERGRQFCTADACFHIQFLAGAIEAWFAGSVCRPFAMDGQNAWRARHRSAHARGKSTQRCPVHTGQRCPASLAQKVAVTYPPACRTRTMPGGSPCL